MKWSVNVLLTNGWVPVHSDYKWLVSVPVCPVLELTRGTSNASNCFNPNQCQVGTTLHYTCDDGFVISLPTTECLTNHTWSNTPNCTKGMQFQILKTSHTMYVHFMYAYVHMQT